MTGRREAETGGGPVIGNRIIYYSARTLVYSRIERLPLDDIESTWAGVQKVREEKKRNRSNGLLHIL